MYQPLEKHAAEFKVLETLLADPRQSAKVQALCVALLATAQNIADQAANGGLTREDAAPLYRGFVAASRVLTQLREAAAEVAPYGGPRGGQG